MVGQLGTPLYFIFSSQHRFAVKRKPLAFNYSSRSGNEHLKKISSTKMTITNYKMDLSENYIIT